MEEKTQFKNIKRKTVISTISLFFQSGYSAILGLIANLVLTIYLSPDVFGIYVTVLSIISLLNYFSDIGLAASLIQKKELHPDDIKTTFTVQQILIVSIITIGFLSTNLIRNFYHLPEKGVILLWALLVSFFISSLKTIPSIFLERNIQFQKIVLVQIIESTVFYITVIIGALSGLGLHSFTVAVFCRAIVGLIAIYIISPWMPQFGLSKSHLKSLLSYGVPFQASSFLALFKDDLITLFLAKVLGFTGLGYIGWAKKWAEAPIRIIMDSISRVLFPVISRLQHDREQIRKILDKILFYQTLILAPTLLCFALLMGRFVEIVPKYGKWEPALPFFYLFVLSAFLSTYSTPFINLFNALGKVKWSFSFMLFWTVVTWICTPLFTRMYGLYGFPVTQVILSLTCFVVVWKARTLLPFDFIRSIYRPILAAGFMGLVMSGVLALSGRSMLAIILASIAGAGVYYGTLLLSGVNLVKELRSLFIHE